MTEFPSGTAFERFLADVWRTSELLTERGWAERNAGNLSVNVSGLVPETPDAAGLRVFECPPAEGSLAGERFLVTGTGVRFRDVADDPTNGTAVIQIDRSARGFSVVWGGAQEGWAPTSELPSHLKVHALLKQSGGRDRTVLHTHPNDLIALTHLPGCPKGPAFTRLIWSMLPEAKMFLPGGARLAPYALPGSGALAEATLAVLKEGAEVVAWEKHGVLAVGPTPLETYDLIDVAEKSARVYLACRAAGEEPLGLSDEQLKEIEKKFPPPPRRG